MALSNELGFNGWLVALIPSESISGVTYDGSSRVTAYTRGLVEHVVTYPDGNTILDVGGGVAREITLDGAGRIVAVSLYAEA